MRLKTAAVLIAAVAAIIFFVNREPAPSPIAARGGGVETGLREVQWGTLRGMDAKTGVASPEVKALNASTVRVPGYIVPLDDNARDLGEFLLVPYMGACVHTPPPPPNQMIYVKMTRGQRAAFGLNDAVWVEGTIFLGSRSSPYGPVFYAMNAADVRRY